MCKQLINNQFYLSLLAASFSPSGLEMDKKCPNWWCLWGVWKVSGRCLEGVGKVSGRCLDDSGYCIGGYNVMSFFHQQSTVKALFKHL